MYIYIYILGLNINPKLIMVNLKNKIMTQLYVNWINKLAFTLLGIWENTRFILIRKRLKIITRVLEFLSSNYFDQ